MARMGSSSRKQSLRMTLWRRWTAATLADPSSPFWGIRQKTRSGSRHPLGRLCAFVFLLALLSPGTSSLLSSQLRFFKKNVETSTSLLGSTVGMSTPVTQPPPSVGKGMAHPVNVPQRHDTPRPHALRTEPEPWEASLDIDMHALTHHTPCV